MADGDTPRDDDEFPSNFDPFAGIPMFGEMSKALAGQGPLSWDAARQFAQMASSAGGDTGNVDPAVRMRYDDLSGVARLHVADVLGLDVPDVRLDVATPPQWAHQTLEAYRPLFNDLATSLSGTPDIGDVADDPMAQMMASLSKMLAPGMLGMGVGSMVGQLATRVFGVYDLPIPRATPTLLLVPSNVDSFAAEWEIDVDEMRLWVLAHELAGATLFSVEHIAERVRSLVQRHVAGFRPDPSAISDKLSMLDTSSDDPMAAVQEALGDPEVLLGAVTSDEQRELAPLLDAAVVVTIGVLDWVVDAVAVRLVGGNALQIADAVRRRRAEASPDDVFVERLLGVKLGAGQTQRGKAFVQGVVDRGGERALEPLFNDPEAFPTPNEVEAPGLWLARVTDAG